MEGLGRDYLSSPMPREGEEPPRINVNEMLDLFPHDTPSNSCAPSRQLSELGTAASQVSLQRGYPGSAPSPRPTSTPLAALETSATCDPALAAMGQAPTSAPAASALPILPLPVGNGLPAVSGTVMAASVPESTEVTLVPPSDTAGLRPSSAPRNSATSASAPGVLQPEQHASEELHSTAAVADPALAAPVDLAPSLAPQASQPHLGHCVETDDQPMSADDDEVMAMDPGAGADVAKARSETYSDDGLYDSNKSTDLGPEGGSSIAKVAASVDGRPCAGCRAAKVRCDRMEPCGRCTRLGLYCYPPEAVQRGRPSRQRMMQRALLQQVRMPPLYPLSLIRPWLLRRPHWLLGVCARLADAARRRCCCEDWRA